MAFPGVSPYAVVLKEVPLGPSAEVIFDEGAVVYEFAGFFDARDDYVEALESGRYEEGRYAVLVWDGTFDEAGAVMDLDAINGKYLNLATAGEVTWTATDE